MIKYLPGAFLLVLLGCKPFPELNTQPDILVDDLKQHIQYLASDKMEGRKVGSKFEQLTAEYMAFQFQRYGLTAVNESYIQEFEFLSSMQPGPGNAIKILSSEPNNLAKDQFSVMGFSATDTVSAELVFAGYGITESEVDYDDYDNIDVNGKIAVILRFTPEGNTRGTPYSRHAPFRLKAKLAKENGARAIWFVTGPDHAEQKDPLVATANVAIAAELGIPAFHVKHAVIDQILEDNGHPSLLSLQESILNDYDPEPHSFALGVSAYLNASVELIMGTSRNTAGALPGSGELADEWIVVGAHFDHLGWGGPTTTTKAPGVHAVHNGADDNASGTAGVLELAEFYTSQPAPENRRSILFMGFGAEEIGLLGSAHYVNNPLIPLTKTVAMLNMDMIGGLTNNQMIMGGTGTSSQWENLLTDQNTDSFELSFNPEGYGSGDHQSFFLKDIPVLFFFTGAHDRYHKPNDDFEYLNFDGLGKIVQYVQRCLDQILIQPEKPDFKKSENPTSTHKRGYSVTIGVIPDFTFTGDGFRISDARVNGPAGQAGLQANDIIISLSGISILNIHDYMYALQQVTAGKEVPIEIIRNEEKLTLMVVPSEKSEESKHE